MGVIDAIGAQVSEFSVGSARRLRRPVPDGAYAARDATCRLRASYRCPRAWMTAAAAMMVRSMTARYLLH